jgi:tetratricopeptide (TPR) repeat protein
MTQGIVPFEFDRVPEIEKLATSVVRQTFADLGRFLDRPSVSAEAHLRRGIIQFQQARLDESLDSLRVASKGAEPDITYLAHLYVGLALDGLNRRNEAVEAFEAALRVVPDARSAIVALTADLFLLDRRTEASKRLETAFGRPAPDDPFRRFSLGDYRFWPAYLNRLREASRS